MEQLRKKDLRGPKKIRDYGSLKNQIISSTRYGCLGPPGIPAGVWLGVERMKQLLDLKKADLIVARRDQERRINFVKDILGTLASILPDVGNAIGTRRYFSEEDP